MIIRRIKKYLPEKWVDIIKCLAAVIPIQLLQGASYWQWRNFLQDAQKWPQPKIEVWQVKKLRSVIQYAYENTEGYRDLYNEAGVSPSDIKTLQDIKILPLTTKQLFQDNLEAFSVKNASSIYITTGGSTGIPFGFYKTCKTLQIEDAFMHTGWSWVGWKFGLRSAVLRGGYIGSEDQPWKYDAYRRELLLSSYFITYRSIKIYIDAIKKYSPKVIQAYPSSLNLFCDVLKDCGEIGTISFDLILLGSENIYDWQMNKFKESFPNSKIFSWYGHAEQVILAPWCEHTNKNHLWPFYGYTEILDEKDEAVKEGEEGELIGTSFHSFITPFIRYRTMDRAIKGTMVCPGCLRSFQLLDSIRGRSHEVIVTKKGRYISMTAINMHDRIFDDLRQFQFFQEEPGKVMFKYVPKKPLSLMELTKIQNGLSMKLGKDMKLMLVQVDEIPRTKAGKYCFLDQRLQIKNGEL